jgi:site-specific DNA recombinase
VLVGVHGLAARTVSLTMFAAIYARKSTEQHSVSDEQKSVARQIDHGRSYAQRKGWTVDEASIFVDDGISGAEFAKRPGFVRLMNAAKPRPRPPFQALIVSELSRLGREQLETGYALKQLSQAGVRVFSYIEDREILLETATDKFLMSAVNFAAEIEREKARQRTYDAMVRKARAGHVTGGEPFGYENVVITGADGKRSHVERRIVEAEAAVVRRIFELSVAGHGLKAITKILNNERASSPRAQLGRPRAWAPSSVRMVLHCESYRGVVVWNKSRKLEQFGQHRQTARPAGEWLRQRAEHLRIVSETLWTSAHAQLTQRRENYRLWTRQDGRRALEARDRRQSYLLSGFAQCGCCGGSMQVISRRSGKEKQNRLFRYGCGQYVGRGVTVCANARQARLELVDAAIRELLAKEVLRPTVIEAALDKAVAMLRAPSRPTADRRALQRELRDVERTLENLADTLANGGAVPAVLERLHREEDKRRRLEGELAALKQSGSKSEPLCLDARALRRTLRGYLDDWHALLTGEIAEARGLLRLVLRERIVFTPIADNNGDAMYRLRVPIGLDGLLEPIVPDVRTLGRKCGAGGTSPTGFEPVFWP